MKARFPVLCVLVLLGQVTASTGQTIQDPGALTAGQWEAVPVAARGEAVLGSPIDFFLKLKDVGTFRVVNSVTSLNTPDPVSSYMTDDGMLVFWAGVERKRPNPGPATAETLDALSDRARTLESAKRWNTKTPGYDWVLFSVRDGRLTRICTDGPPVSLPGYPKAYIRPTTSKIVPMKDHVLISFNNGGMLATEQGYVAWNGQQFSEFIHGEMSFKTSAGDFKVGNIYDLGKDERGALWILLNAKNNRGNQTMYWIQDGTAFTPILSTIGKFPGTQHDVKINSFIPSQFVLPSGLLLQADGGKLRGSVLRIRESQTEELVKWATLESLLGAKMLWDARLSSAADADTFTLVTQASQGANFKHASLFFYSKGKIEKVFDIESVGGDKESQFWVNDGFFLRGSPVAYVFSAGSKLRAELSGGLAIVVQLARLYSFDGTTVAPLPNGFRVEPKSMRVLQTPLGKIVTFDSPKGLQSFAVKTGADGKKSIEPLGEASAQKSGIVFMGPNGVSCLESPRFNLPPDTPEIALTDVVGWVNDREVIAVCDSGVYRLRRIDQAP